jgi:hypothetical protein
MSNKVFCIKHQKDEPAIDVHIPFRGELKERVRTNICQGVWEMARRRSSNLKGTIHSRPSNASNLLYCLHTQLAGPAADLIP